MSTKLVSLPSETETAVSIVDLKQHADEPELEIAKHLSRLNAGNQMQVKETRKAPHLFGEGTILEARWRIGKLIAEGGFGEIYEASDTTNKNAPVAVKAESLSSALPLLRLEITVFKEIQSYCQKHGNVFAHFLRFYGCGWQREASFIVMELCGRNLMELKKRTKYDRLTAGCSLRLACQMIQSLHDLHSTGWLHRDVKPSNFCMGSRTENRRTLFLIDFGLCRQYVEANSNEHKLPRNRVGFRGTIRYGSVNVHDNKDSGRVDDLWSVFYILLEQILGQLPWRRMTDKARVRDMKEMLNYKRLLSHCPSSLRAMRSHLTAINYFSLPHYHTLIEAFQRDIQNLRIDQNGPLDWETLDSH